MIYTKNWSKLPPKHPKMSKYQKSKKQVLFVEKKRENKATGKDFYIL